MDDLINEFLIESLEGLDGMDQQLLELEMHPNDKVIINGIFRTIHTIKGTCGFLGLGKLEKVTHVGEYLLDNLRSGRCVYDESVASLLLELVDVAREMLRSIETTGSEGEKDYSDLVARMKAVYESEREAPAQVPAGVAEEARAGESLSNEEQFLRELDQSLSRHRKDADEERAKEAKSAVLTVEPHPDLSGETERDTPISTDDVTNYELLAELLGEDTREPGVSKSKPSEEGDEMPVDQGVPIASEWEGREAEIAANGVEADEEEKMNLKSPPPVEATVSEGEQKTAEVPKAVDAASPRSQLAESSLRVDVALLDQLMNLVGELVLARNQILQFSKVSADAAFSNTCQRLNHITSELQERVMKTRMQPISNVWNKFPRIVRDVARACGKEITLEMYGEDTDLDKTILEAIKDPLTHIVRNSADHGIELPEERERKGKDRCGTLTLRAFHEGGHVIIEIADDGAGLNLEKIKTKAIERGLLTREQANQLREREICDLVFLPGFSTADAVTNVSGRGVGMDVVRSNVEKIGGQVDITSVQGSGTTLTVKIPLTLAIIPALIVVSNDQRFAIPQVDLLELLRIEAENVPAELESIGGTYFYRLRGNLLPLVNLETALGLKELWVPNECNGAINIVVVRAGEQEMGIVVDGIFDTEEIVVKPLGRQLQGIEVLSGAAIMGDGRVSLILDVHGIAKHAAIFGNDQLESVVKGGDEDEDVAGACERVALLIAQSQSGGRYSIPLARVNRLEEMPVSSLERSGGRCVVQYRGGIMPLIRLEDFLRTGEPEVQRDTASVVVFQVGSRYVGLIVGKIQDVLEEELDIRYKPEAAGIVGSAIVGGKVSDLLDLDLLLAAFSPPVEDLGAFNEGRM